jgi:hypothetical protein
MEHRARGAVKPAADGRARIDSGRRCRAPRAPATGRAAIGGGAGSNTVEVVGQAALVADDFVF